MTIPVEIITRQDVDFYVNAKMKSILDFLHKDIEDLKVKINDMDIVIKNQEKYINKLKEMMLAGK